MRLQLVQTTGWYSEGGQSTWGFGVEVHHFGSESYDDEGSHVIPEGWQVEIMLGPWAIQISDEAGFKSIHGGALVRLRKPCKEHGRYERHDFFDTEGWEGPDGLERHAPIVSCPGGEFLPEGALVKVWWCLEHQTDSVVSSTDAEGKWMGIIPEYCWYWQYLRGPKNEKPCRFVEVLLLAASQVGES